MKTGLYRAIVACALGCIVGGSAVWVLLCEQEDRPVMTPSKQMRAACYARDYFATRVIPETEARVQKMVCG